MFAAGCEAGTALSGPPASPSVFTALGLTRNA
jgi:hypothetical protein